MCDRYVVGEIQGYDVIEYFWNGVGNLERYSWILSLLG